MRPGAGSSRVLTRCRTGKAGPPCQAGQRQRRTVESSPEGNPLWCAWPCWQCLEAFGDSVTLPPCPARPMGRPLWQLGV